MSVTQGPERWITSSAGGENGNCVAVSLRAADVHVRDSKHPTGPWSRFPADVWDQFVAAVAAGRVDRARLLAASGWVGASDIADGGPEAAAVADDVGLRDGAHPNGPVLVFTPAEWDAFVIGAGQGELRSARTALAG